jgi:hypothetical protein
MEEQSSELRSSGLVEADIVVRNVMMEKVPLQSKGIDWVAYDKEAQTLYVQFNSSQPYRYFDVPPAVYTWLLRAPSKGKFVNRLVKDRYRYERLDIGSSQEGDPDLLALLEKSLTEPR